MSKKKKNSIMRFCAAIMLLMFVLNEPLQAVAATPEIMAVLKSDIAEDDADRLSTSPKRVNVLLLLESTAAMSFSIKGVMPLVTPDQNDSHEGSTETADWKRTKEVYGYGFDDITRMMEQCTFGMGALPTAWSGGNINKERNLYGRDLDSGNNYVKSGNSIEEDMEANKDRYYFPFNDPANAKALKEAYKSQTRELEIRFDSAIEPLNKYGGPEKAANMNYVKIPPPGQLGKYYLGEGASKYKQYNHNTVKGDKDGTTYPYALVFKDARYWKNGWPAGSSPTRDDLVPNDSRMYQMKLVLWRLLQDESLFKNIRLGLASTFLNPVNMKPGLSQVPHVTWDNSPHVGVEDRSDLTSIFRVPPFGGNIVTQNYFDTSKKPAEPTRLYTYHWIKAPNGYTPWPGTFEAKNYKVQQYKNGVLLPFLTGHAHYWGGMHAQFFPLWANSNISLNYTNNIGAASKLMGPYMMTNRASLHVPMMDIGHVWRKVRGDKAYEMNHMDKIRMWINGLGDIKSGGIGSSERESQFHFYKDPEIGIAGAYALPMAIFPNPDMLNMNRDSYLNGSGIWYSNRSLDVDYQSRSAVKAFREDSRAMYNAGSGEAAGSVIDFFSPLINYSIAESSKNVDVSTPMTVNDLADVSFPIQCSGEDNWVIVISSGVNVKPADNTSYRYNLWDAAKNLYDYTDRENPKHMKVTSMYYEYNYNGKKTRRLKEIDLDNPIRTLVVGIVGNPDDPEISSDPILKKQVMEARENLNRMARAGQGDDPYDEKSEITAYFADDILSLLDALKSALSVVNDSVVRQPDRGTLLETPPLGDQQGSLYVPSYRVRHANQWEATLTKYDISMGGDGKMRLSRKWELGKNILEAKNAEKQRPLKYWGGSALKDLKPDDPTFETLLGLNRNNIAPDDASAGGLPLHKAFYRWLDGYDYSYTFDKNYNRRSMLADMGQSGVVCVNAPSPVDSLPGYKKWAEDVAARGGVNPRLYTQTNDGILHVVDPKNGNEKMAILPPPVLLPARLASMKTVVSEDKFRWIEVKNSDRLGGYRSNPVYTLDGPLQKRRFNLGRTDSEKDWGTYLLGTLGRGGSGLYMTDVSAPDSPKFMWYKERIGDSLMHMDAGSSSPSAVSFEMAANDRAFEKLGFNSPRPAMGVTGAINSVPHLLNFIALPGGAQRSVDLSHNGNEGAVLLMLDPKDGGVIRAFDSSSLINAPHVGNGTAGNAPYMGMMVSEPALYRSKLSPYLTGRIFTADNRGNIFSIFLEDIEQSGVVPLAPSDWRIETVATLQTAASANHGTSSYAIPHGLLVADHGSEIWIAGGTSDIRTVKTGNPNTQDGVIRNESQMIFSLNSSNSGSKPLVRDVDLKELKTASSNDDDLSLNPGDGKRGWYIMLEEDHQNSFREYVVGKPILKNGMLFFATFIEKKMNLGDTNPCGSRTINGDSRIYALDVTTGKGLMQDKDGKRGSKYVTLTGVKITGMTNSIHDSILATVDVLSGLNNMDQTGHGNISRIGSENIMQLTDKFFNNGSESGTMPLALTDGQSVILYWIQK